MGSAIKTEDKMNSSVLNMLQGCYGWGWKIDKNRITHDRTSNVTSCAMTELAHTMPKLEQGAKMVIHFINVVLHLQLTV